MIHHKLFMASAIIVSAAITACSDSTAPTPLVQSGALHVTKECSAYTGQGGDFCTITSSNLKEIEVGSTVTYASAASAQGILETDVVLDPPGSGDDIAFGHCSVDLTAINGTRGCVFSGGTGKFKWFHAEVKLSLVDAEDPATELVWNGTYSFSPGD